ncbi:MAG: translation initiation factor IF-2 N-terminal domain-containing protein, partial [Desulfitobacteriaceae bacterium]
MTNIRVHELAKELNLNSKDVVSRLEAMGVDVKNHLSSVEQADADRLRVTNGSMGKETARIRPEPHSSAPQENNLSEGQGHFQRPVSAGRLSQGSSQTAIEQEGEVPDGGVTSSALPKREPVRPGTENRPSRTDAEGEPIRPGMEGRPPRPSGEGHPQGPRPGMEGRPPRPSGEGHPQGPRPGMEGRPPRPSGEGHPQGPRPGMEGRPPRPSGEGHPQGPRPGMEGRPPRPSGEGHPQGPRPGMEGRPPRPSG